MHPQAQKNTAVIRGLMGLFPPIGGAAQEEHRSTGFGYSAQGNSKDATVPNVRTSVSTDERGMANEIRRKAESDQIYRHIRSEIQYEHSLMNARVNWLIASQAFLFVPLAIGIDPRQPPRSIAHSLLFPFIPYLGLVLCLLALIGIVAAVWRVENWRRKMARGGYGGDGEHDTFSIIQSSQPAVVIMGYCSAVGIPLVLAAAWVILRFFPPTLA